MYSYALQQQGLSLLLAHVSNQMAWVGKLRPDTMQPVPD